MTKPISAKGSKNYNMFSPERHIPFSSLQYLTCFWSFQTFYSKGYLLPLEQCSCATALLTSRGVRVPGGGWQMAALGTWLARVSYPLLQRRVAMMWILPRLQTLM